MKQNKLKNKFEEELRQNYDIISILISQPSFLQQVNYQERLFLILDNHVPLSKILYFCRKEYPNQQPQISKTDLIRDAIKLKSHIVNYAWRFDRADPNRKQQRSFSLDSVGLDKLQRPEKRDGRNEQEKGEENEQKQEVVKNRQKSNRKALVEQKQRRTVLQQLLANMQGKITMTKNQQQQAELIKKYNQISKELNFLRNKIRIENQDQILKEVKYQSSGEVPAKLNHLLTKMKEIKQGNKKILARQDNTLSEKSYIRRQLEILRLRQIFIFYSKKQTQIQTKYFGEIEKVQSVLHLQLFLKFCQDWKINRILSIEQITNIFKSHSKGKRFIDQLAFSEILGDIHRLECIKEQRAISMESIRNYIQKYIVNEEKMVMVGVKAEKDARKKQKRSQKKLMKGHTGKHEFDIRQDIEEKKKTIDFLAGPRNILKYEKLKEKFKSIQVMENSKAKIHTNYGAGEIGTTINSNDTINSYAFRFKYKNRKTRIRTEGGYQIESFHQKDLPKNQTSLLLEQNTESINNRKKTYDIRYQRSEDNKNFEYGSDEGYEKKEQEGKKKRLEGFQDLIQQSQQDQYLNKHLLPPINTKNNNLFKIIHY